jgi:hypothetical protein
MHAAQAFMVLSLMAVESFASDVGMQSSTESPTPTPATLSSAPAPSPSVDVIVSDAFEAEDGLMTSHEYYTPGDFPFGGASLSSNPSPVWEGDSGFFYRQGHWGYSGRPRDWKDRYFFRMNTRNFNIQDAAISWRYRSAQFGEDGYASESADAVDVWLRYQTQYNLYVFQFDRADDRFQAKRKIPAQGWTGPATLIANKGVYYTLPTDDAQPIVGAGKLFITWSAVQKLLPPSEASKPRFPKLAHDGVTPYDFKVTVRNVEGNKVQVQAYRAGALIYSATDDGRSGVAANGETQEEHLERGYYDTVPGWQGWWASPIIHPGASGFRADDVKFWIADFVVKRLK